MKVIAHRGWSAIAPENTEIAIEKAIELGVDMIEIDVRRTIDNKLVVFHDAKLSRTTSDRGMVRRKTWAQLKSLEHSSWFDIKLPAQRILRLEEVLEMVKGKTRLMIEVKVDKKDHFDHCTPKLIKAIKKANAESEVCISSFRTELLEKIHFEAPELELHKLLVFKIPLSPFYFDEKITRGEIFKEPYLSAINLDYRYVTTPLIQYLRKQNKEIYSWTANKKRPMKRLIRMGVDGIITNYPSILRKLIDEHKDEEE